MLFWKRKNTENKKKRSALKEWVNAAVFAIIVATMFRTFAAEAYTIPTGSMEGSMLVNDYLFVSKMAYGPRIPMTPLAVPLIHNSIPVVGSKSYSDAVQWKYRRLPGFGSVERNDVVVFNAPEGDTAIDGQPDMNYYQVCRMLGRQAVLSRFNIVTHPVDKKDNLIKRCIGLPGDVVDIRDARVYVNGKASAIYPHSKLNYIVKTNGKAPGVDENVEWVHTFNNDTYIYNLANDQLQDVKKAPNVVSVSLFEKDAKGTAPQEPGEWVFPLDPAHYKWNRDNMGPLTVPKAGATVKLTPENIAMYRRIIRNYESNTLEEQNGRFLINGNATDQYTFKMDYYWMMGDNRHNSLDSRYWGFVPEDHIVGKASFVWLSYSENGLLSGLRWDRMFRSIHSLEN